MSILAGRRLGLRMLDWHGGQGDPIYAVGSVLLAGRSHYRGVVLDALGNIERLARTSRKLRDKRDLGAIARGLQRLLDRGLVVERDEARRRGLVSANYLADEVEPDGSWSGVDPRNADDEALDLGRDG